MIDYEPVPVAPQRRHLLSFTLSWLVILGAIGYVAVGVNLANRKSRVREASSDVDDVQFRLAARTAIGTKAMLAGLSQKPDTAQLMANVDKNAHTVGEQIRAAIVAGELDGPQEALSRLSKLKAGDLKTSEDLLVLTEIYAEGSDSIDTDQRADLLRRYPWYAQLALTSDLPSDGAAHRDAVAPARETMISLAIFGSFLFLIGVAGLGLFITAIVLLALGSLRSTYLKLAPARSGPPVFLEAFAIYIAGFILFGELLARFVHPQTLAWYMLATFLLPFALAWPVIRGRTWSDVRNAFGYRAPRGIFLEPIMGLLGYIAALPVLAIGFWISNRLSKLVGASPSHPIINELHGSAAHIAMLYILASVWAPIMEETMFRGALFHHLRGRWNVVISSLVVGVFFALVHPQGWTLIPALGSIGMILCLIREWRGSILGCMTAHAFNNAVVLTLAMKVLA